MVCHVDFSVEAIHLSSLLSDSEIDKVAQLPWGEGEGRNKRFLCQQVLSLVGIYLHR